MQHLHAIKKCIFLSNDMKSTIYIYYAFGLHFSLPFECTRLSPVVDRKKVDIEIRFSEKQYQPALQNFETQHAQKVYLTIDSVANFHIENGNKISIAVAPDTDLDTVMLFLFGSAFGVILYQRHYLVLHGCTIEHNGICHSFVGPSGIGKSTLATSFMLQEFNVISDDVCAIQFIHQKPYVFPGFPDIKLWKTALEKYNLSYHHLNSVRPNEKKYYFPLSKWKLDPVPLHSVTLLSQEKNFTLTPVKGFEKYQLLVNNLYRPNFASQMKLSELHFKALSNMLPYLKINQLTRPNHGFQLKELTHLIKQEIFEETPCTIN